MPYLRTQLCFNIGEWKFRIFKPEVASLTTTLFTDEETKNSTVPRETTMEFQVSPVFLSLGCLKGKLSFLYEMLTHHPPTSNLDPLCTVNIVAKVALLPGSPPWCPCTDHRAGLWWALWSPGWCSHLPYPCLSSCPLQPQAGLRLSLSSCPRPLCLWPWLHHTFWPYMILLFLFGLTNGKPDCVSLIVCSIDPYAWGCTWHLSPLWKRSSMNGCWEGQMSDEMDGERRGRCAEHGWWLHGWMNSKFMPQKLSTNPRSQPVTGSAFVASAVLGVGP
jgi:hypothetical protein